MSSVRSHRVGKPLDANEAIERAAQAAAVGDVVNLRVLSAIAAGVPDAMLASTLHLAFERVQIALGTLQGAALVFRGDAGEWVLSASAWVRFGRLLAETPLAHGSVPDPSPVIDLPLAVEKVARDLAYRFSSTFSAETVSRYVAESYLLLSQRANVREHLPTLTARYAADRLDALASARGLILRGTPEVLFVCVQNAGRSQLAAAYLRHLAGSAVHVRTAGSAPASEVHPRIVETLAEVGVPLSDEYPKPLTDEVVQAADYVVTMGCGDACPVYPGRRYLDWELDDPLELNADGIRRVRDEIRAYVEGLLVELGFSTQQANR